MTHLWKCEWTWTCHVRGQHSGVRSQFHPLHSRVFPISADLPCIPGWLTNKTQMTLLSPHPSLGCREGLLIYHHIRPLFSHGSKGQLRQLFIQTAQQVLLTTNPSSQPGKYAFSEPKYLHFL